VNQDCVRIIGRVINMSKEDAKLQNPDIGLFNANMNSSTSQYRIKLDLTEVKEYSLFEGEIIVAEGFNDIKGHFNVNRIFKP